MKHFIIGLSFFVVSAGFGIVHAQVKGKLNISYSSDDFITSPKSANGVINCKVNDKLFKKGGAEVKLFFYAINDRTNNPMELVYKGKPLVPKFLAPRKPRGELMVFTVHANDIFFPDKTTNGYSWKWRARARVPDSPIMGTRGEKVKTVKCWYVLRQGKQTFISDTLSIKVHDTAKSL